MFQSQEANKDESLNDFNCDMSTPPFEDSISCICWTPALGPGTKPTMFAVGTWDGYVRVFNVEQNQQGNVCIMQKFSMKVSAPIMGLAWNAQNTGLFAGCGDNSIRGIDLTSSKDVPLGKHNSPVKDVFFVAAQNMVISTSYDKNINIWQPGNPNPVFNLPLNNKVYVADFVNPIFGAGLSEEKVMLFDINNINRKVILDSQLGR